MKKLAIVSTHPIQYNAPWFQLLAQRQHIAIKVFYTWSQAKDSVDDKDFGKAITWDIPLLEGYEYTFIDNKAKDPGVHHFFGIDCPDLIRAIQAFRPEAVLVFGWNFKSHLKVMRFFKDKIPVWFRGDSTLINETAGFRTQLRRAVLSWVYGYVDKALYVGKANKAYFLKHGLKEEQLYFAPHAIDNERFFDDARKNYEQQARTWREALGYSLNDVVLLYAGKFEPNKQLHVLLDALIEVNKTDVSPIKLLLIGNGPLEEQLKEKAKPYDFVTFRPFQNQTKMPIVYRLGNVFCLPSISETWGLAINEAMACGRPVLVSDRVGCAKDLVNINTNGWIFRHQDKNDLIQQLQKLSTEEIRMKGERVAHLIKTWSFNAIAEAIEKAMNSEG